MYFLGPLMAFLCGSEVEETTQVSQCGPTYLSTEAWRLLIVLLPDYRSCDGSLTRLRPGETRTVHSEFTERRHESGRSLLDPRRRTEPDSTLHRPDHASEGVCFAPAEAEGH